MEDLYRRPGISLSLLCASVGEVTVPPTLRARADEVIA
jgi:hypothetical protein